MPSKPYLDQEFENDYGPITNVTYESNKPSNDHGFLLRGKFETKIGKAAFIFYEDCHIAGVNDKRAWPRVVERKPKPSLQHIGLID